MKKLLTILGPTASGKTRLAVEVAEVIKGEIISADSRQVFRGMDIGTGKDLEEYSRPAGSIPYHLVNILNAGEEYSVYDFQRDFTAAFEDIAARQSTPILCGGTGLYLSSVLEQYTLPESKPNPELREELESLDMESLRERLQSSRIPHNSTDLEDKSRLIKAIEIAESKETPPADLPAFKPCVIGIDLPRPILHERIEHRLNERLKHGMIEEVAALMESVPIEMLDQYGLEYRYISKHVCGDLRYNDMQQKLLSAIKRFAKRQSTWFRRMERHGVSIHWIDGTAPKAAQLENIYLQLQTI